MRQYRYTVDGDGRIFHEGSEIIDPAVLRFFARAMQQAPDGRHLVMCQGEQNWFEASDTPLVVLRVRLEIGERGLVRIDLVLAGEHLEPLDPGTLETEGDRLYCRIRRGTLRARFGRVALQQLGRFLAEAEGGPALILGDVAHPIRVPARSIAPAPPGGSTAGEPP